MRYLVATGLVLLVLQSQAQTIVGTWQLTEEKTCFQSEMKESETEKELRKDMGSTANSVARVITFDKKGNGEDGIFSTGLKKAANMSTFKYKVNGQTLMMLDTKSGILTQQLVIDELTETTLTVHNSKKECETKSFSRIK